MKEPSNKDIKKEKQSELDKIADINAKCVAGYQTIRKTVYNNISDGDLVKMNKYVYTEYGKVYTGLKGMIIDALNDAKDKNVKLVEKLLDESLPPAKHYKVLPKTAPFKYTNRVFTEKSVSVRSQKAADTITKIIADGRNDGLAIKDIQKKIDIVMGFRDAQGRYTDKSKALIEAGKFTHRNGSIYETYRIARTEVMRMNAFAKYDQFEELKKKYPNVRLKLIATIDGRERLQSKEMNGQISNDEGEFLYPDNKRYRLGTAPAQWCINDRETQVIVFLDSAEVKEQSSQSNSNSFVNSDNEINNQEQENQTLNFASFDKSFEQPLKELVNNKDLEVREIFANAHKLKRVDIKFETDTYYNPVNNTVNISPGIFNSRGKSALAHELGHYFDYQLIALKDKTPVPVFSNSLYALKEDIDKFSIKKVSDTPQKVLDTFAKVMKEPISEKNKWDSISDIYCSLSEGKLFSSRKIPFGHSPNYYKQAMDNKYTEIFANYFAMRAENQVKQLQFLKDNSPEVFTLLEKSFKMFIKELKDV